MVRKLSGSKNLSPNSRGQGGRVFPKTEGYKAPSEFGNLWEAQDC